MTNVFESIFAQLENIDARQCRIELMLAKLLTNEETLEEPASPKPRRRNTIEEYEEAIRQVMTPGLNMHYTSIYQALLGKDLLPVMPPEGDIGSICRKLHKRGALQKHREGQYIYLPTEEQNEQSI